MRGSETSRKFGSSGDETETLDENLQQFAVFSNKDAISADTGLMCLPLNIITEDLYRLCLLEVEFTIKGPAVSIDQSIFR